MKVLTIRQPWATLTALGVRTIETRSWSTQYRGPLAIHAAVRPEAKDFRLGMAVLHAQRRTGVGCAQCGCSDSLHACEFTQTRCFCRACDGWKSQALPLGAIVATCTLVDVVPITNLGEETAVQRVEVGTMGGTPNLMLCAADPGPEVIQDLDRGFDKLLAARFDASAVDPEAGVDFDVSDCYERDVTDQRPYGDFTPGRYAWLLADVEPVDPPVPFKGGQGLTKTWTPE